MGHAVRTGRDAAVAGGDLHVQTRVVDAVAHLVKGPHAGEHGIGARKGDEPCGRHAGCRSHHVLFGNAEIKRSLRELLREFVGPIDLETSASRTPRQGFFPQLEQLLRVGMAGRLCFALEKSSSEERELDFRK